MKVLYVVNNFYVKGNGLSASAQRTVKYLRESGLDVKVLSGAEETSDVLPDFDIVINTVPARLLDKERLRVLKPGCLCLDLASKPEIVEY